MASFNFYNGEILPYQFEPEYDTDEISSASDESDDPSQEESEEKFERLISTDWCRCDNCRLLPTVKECVCCHEVHGDPNRMENGLRCVTSNPDFDKICLDVEVLRVSILARADIRGDNVQEPISNEVLCHQAYRQFMYWNNPKNIGRVIPACAVWKIRDAFPSESGQYTGFKNG